LKQSLKIKTFVGTSGNAVRAQIWTALIAMENMKQELTITILSDRVLIEQLLADHNRGYREDLTTKDDLRILAISSWQPSAWREFGDRVHREVSESGKYRSQVVRANR
jgi:hypothetical protein